MTFSILLSIQTKQVIYQDSKYTYTSNIAIFPILTLVLVDMGLLLSQRRHKLVSIIVAHRPYQPQCHKLKKRILKKVLYHYYSPWYTTSTQKIVAYLYLDNETV